jgi:hypothetical protein
MGGSTIILAALMLIILEVGQVDVVAVAVAREVSRVDPVNGLFYSRKATNNEGVDKFSDAVA